MKKVLIFAGTTEGRDLSDRLDMAGIDHEVCVATEYGEQVLSPKSHRKVRMGRLDADEMRALFESEQYLAVVDATHPYAAAVTENILKSLKGIKIPYLRLGRETKACEQGDLRFFDDAASCADALKEQEGNILLTTGSKDLPVFCADEKLRERLFARVLPGAESLRLCEENGLEGRQIIAMQGPFGTEMNLALIGQFRIAALVTKESGRTGGADEKLAAAAKAGIPCYVIKKPVPAAAVSELTMAQVVAKLEELTGVCLNKKAHLNIILGGIGMGDAATRTCELHREILQADYLFGAERMLKGLEGRKGKYPYYLAEDILPCLEKLRSESTEPLNIVVLYSGDTGFYSGCSKLYKALENVADCSVKILPGISSLSAFCAKIGETWQDAAVVSAHGVEEQVWSARLMHALRHEDKVFFLTSGTKTIHRIGEILRENKLTNSFCLTFGYNLSYENEKIISLDCADCESVTEDGLCVGMLRRTDKKAVQKLTPGFADSTFLRAKVPMTKEEVRILSVCKLDLTANSVVYDVGSGTGSVSAEIAALSPDIKVYAVEKEADAAELTRQNAEQLGLYNIHVIEGRAPEAMEDLPAPTHAFLGGTGGDLREILTLLRGKNPSMRIVMNTVTLESTAAITELLNEFSSGDEDIVTLSVSKAKKVGRYHMMEAGNPVTVFSFTLGQRDGE